MKTRKQYMNKEVSHHDYNSQFITESTKRFILSWFDPKQIAEALDNGDKHLNNIKIPYNNMGSGGRWWWDDTPYNRQLVKLAGDSNSQSTATCIGKAAARNIAQEYKDSLK